MELRRNCLPMTFKMQNPFSVYIANAIYCHSAWLLSLRRQAPLGQQKISH